MINEDKKSRGQEDKQETNNPSPLVGEGRVRGYYGLPRFARNDEKTCHPERRIDLRVSGSHNYETLKQAPTSILPHKGGSISPSLEGRLGWVPIKSAVVKSSKKVAFTLAEVLITLGIIGIVAAMTMPTLIENHNKKVVETRLQKFYSSMNQAIQMAEKDYGSRDIWFARYTWRDGEDVQKAWLDKYIIPYLNITGTSSITYSGKEYPAIHFADGSFAALNYSTADWIFTTCDINKCLAQPRSRREGSCLFSFSFSPPSTWNFEPYNVGWNGSENSLKHGGRFGCYDSTSGETGGYCTKLIQYNGWKIPKDYPYRVKYR